MSEHVSVKSTKSNSRKPQCKRLLSCLKKFRCIKINLDGDAPIDLNKLLVINHNSPGYLAFNFFVTFCCLVSSYIAVYMACHRITMEGKGFTLVVFIMYSFEAVFMLDIFVNFLLSYEYMSPLGKQVQRDVIEIAKHYLTTTFYKDLIPIVPLQMIELKNNRNTLFYLIKLFRLAKGFRLLDVFYLMKKIKEIFKNYNENVQGVSLLLKDEKLANNTNFDHNKIQLQLLIGYILKITRIVIEILNFAYLLCSFWYIMLKLIEDFEGVDYKQINESRKDGQPFIPYYGIQHKSEIEITITLLYFSMTSLATVGFGDYCPRSDFERAAGAFMLLCGVACFSYIMGNFI